MRSILGPALGFALALSASLAHAQETVWRPPAAALSAPVVTLGQPVVSLGRPVASDPGPGVVLGRPSIVNEQVTRVSYADPLLSEPQPVFRGQVPDAGGPSLMPPPGSPVLPPGGPVLPPAPPPGDPYANGMANTPPPPPAGGGFLGWCEGLVGGGGSSGRCAFQSDHCFPDFISPVSSPFLSEDPRSLTEIKPIFIWQQTPRGTPVFRGGDIEFAGLQARLALTDRLSIVMNKLGFIWIEPHDQSTGVQPEVELTELWLGPKYTFIRNEQSGTLAALGVTFQIPIGGANAFQDTGTLSVAPYLSFGQRFCAPGIGSFHFMDTTGYAFSTDNKRSEYVYSNFHVDYDILDNHHFYPLLELNYLDYTRKGTSEPINFEGGDLFNFGSTGVTGRDYLSIAPGFRYKFNECIQTGIAAEFPLLHHDLQDFRLTVDLIFRY